MVLRSVGEHGYFRLARLDGAPIVYNGWKLEIAVDDTMLDKFGHAQELKIDSLLIAAIGAQLH